MDFSEQYHIEVHFEENISTKVCLLGICKNYDTNYVPQAKFGRHIVFAPFLIIITSPRLLSGDVLLFYYSYYSSSTYFCPLDFSEMP